MGNGTKIRVLAALASANVFPALAVIWQLDRVREILAKPGTSIGRIIVTGAIALFVSGALSYVGAAYLSGSLADTEYLLEVNIFRGIKLTFVLPIILVAIAFLQRFDVFDGRMDLLKRIIKYDYDLVVKVQEDKATIVSAREQLDKDKESADALVKDAETKKNDMLVKKKNKDKLLDKAKYDRDTSERAYNELMVSWGEKSRMHSPGSPSRPARPASW